MAVLLLLAAVSCRGGQSGGDDTGVGPRSYQRLAVMAPAAAEMLNELNTLDRIVAVGDFVRWPSELAMLPTIGAYDAPNLEQLLSLKVDLLVTVLSEAARPAHDRLRELGIDVLALRLDTYAGVLESIPILGRRLGVAAESTALADSLRAAVAGVRSRTAGLVPRSVLVVVDREPLYVAGPGSHLDELLGIVGARNVMADTRGTYQLASLEAVLQRRPEVIIDISDNGPGALRGRKPGPWANWGFLPAVNEGRVYWVDPQRLSIPGPRIPEMAELMARMIHPDTFGEPSADQYGPLSGRSGDAR
jgi:ABC-type Fe3+-hydroxamate transport system substrate-binding protein